MDFIHPLANEYAAQYSNATPAYLKEVYETTLATQPNAHMQSSWTQGGFLSLIQQIIATQVYFGTRYFLRILAPCAWPKA